MQKCVAGAIEGKLSDNRSPQNHEVPQHIERFVTCALIVHSQVHVICSAIMCYQIGVVWALAASVKSVEVRKGVPIPRSADEAASSDNLLKCVSRMFIADPLFPDRLGKRNPILDFKGVSLFGSRSASLARQNNLIIYSETNRRTGFADNDAHISDGPQERLARTVQKWHVPRFFDIDDQICNPQTLNHRQQVLHSVDVSCGC